MDIDLRKISLKRLHELVKLKRKQLDTRPKQKLSDYNIFVREMYPVMRKQNPERYKNVGNFTKDSSDQGWFAKWKKEKGLPSTN